MSDQIPLFDLDPAVADDPSVAAVAQVHAEARAIAAGLPGDIRFGTSSWSFPGWKGIYWSAMPGLMAQARIVPPEDLPFAVIRLLLRPGTRYQEQRARSSRSTRSSRPMR